MSPFLKNIGRQSIHNKILLEATTIDYMFRPFFIRPSSGLAWRSKDEQCSSVRCKVHYVLNLGFVENEICTVPIYYAMLDLKMAL